MGIRDFIIRCCLRIHVDPGYRISDTSRVIDSIAATAHRHPFARIVVGGDLSFEDSLGDRQNQLDGDMVGRRNNISEKWHHSLGFLAEAYQPLPTRAPSIDSVILKDCFPD